MLHLPILEDGRIMSFRAIILAKVNTLLRTVPHRSLGRAARLYKIPKSTIYRWLHDGPISARGLKRLDEAYGVAYERGLQQQLQRALRK